jgi:hypothetical protein
VSAADPGRDVTAPAAGPAAAGHAAREAGPSPEDHRSTSEVVTSLLANGQALAAKELELAKHELAEVVRDKAIAIGLVVFAAILGLFILGFIGVTTAVAL